MKLKKMCWMFQSGYTDDTLVECPYCSDEFELDEVHSAFVKLKDGTEQEIECPSCKRTMKVTVDRPIKIAIFREQALGGEGGDESPRDSAEEGKEKQCLCKIHNEGEGWIYVQNGPDDVDKEPCECQMQEDDDGKCAEEVPEPEQSS